MAVAVAADPAADPGEEDVAREGEKDREDEQAGVAGVLDAHAAPAAEDAAESEDGGQEGVLRRGLVLVADAHEEGEESAGAEAEGERLEHRGAVKVRPVEREVRDGRVREVRHRLNETEDPQDAEEDIARREEGDDERSETAEDDTADA